MSIERTSGRSECCFRSPYAEEAQQRTPFACHVVIGRRQNWQWDPCFVRNHRNQCAPSKGPMIERGPTPKCDLLLLWDPLFHLSPLAHGVRTSGQNNLHSRSLFSSTVRTCLVVIGPRFNNLRPLLSPLNERAFLVPVWTTTLPPRKRRLTTVALFWGVSSSWNGC
jgi:hypothetical protein